MRLFATLAAAFALEVEVGVAGHIQHSILIGQTVIDILESIFFR